MTKLPLRPTSAYFGSSCRQWSSLLCLNASNDVSTRREHRHRALSTPKPITHTFTSPAKRYFGISRHLDPLARNESINILEEPDGGVAEKIQEFWDDEKEDNGDYDIFGGISGTDRGEPKEELGQQATAAYQARQLKLKEEFDGRKGRLWDDSEWIIPDDEWLANESWDDIEEWKPSLATRVSLDSVKVFKGGVPTLAQLSGLELPPALTSHPGHGKPAVYASYRKRQIKSRLHIAIQLSIHDDLQKILKYTSWEEKQHAVDKLFEVIEDRVREREPILGKLPEFGDMVERGLESVLRMVQSRVTRQKGAKSVVLMPGGDSGRTATHLHDVADDTSKETTESTGESKENTEEKEVANREPKIDEDVLDVMNIKKEKPVPIFMDLLVIKGQTKVTDDEDDNASSNKKALSTFLIDSNDKDVPNLIYPLNVHHNDGVGRMVEEWELAANKDTKRIMMRDAMKEVASKIVEAANCCSGDIADEKKGAARVFVTGKNGVGKTALLAGIVASSRISGHIVAFMPDGDRLRKHGYYVEPCTHRKGLYNMPEIAKELCGELLNSHGDDVNSILVGKESMKDYLADEQIVKLFKKASEAKYIKEDATELSLNALLTIGEESTSLSSGCHNMCVSTLMNQKEKPFTVVMDEFNCYFDHGHYFHMDYDEDVRRAIPPNKLTVFKPFLDAMGLYPSDAGTEFVDDIAVKSSDAMMKWGSMVVATSESRAVRQSFTRSLTASALALTEDNHHPMHVVDVNRFSSTEVQHILYNFEVTGIGRLRFDRGDTTLNREEVDYLRLVSGGKGQQLMDACMCPRM